MPHAIAAALVVELYRRDMRATSSCHRMTKNSDAMQKTWELDIQFTDHPASQACAVFSGGSLNSGALRSSQQ